jgi:hypothetical protein
LNTGGFDDRQCLGYIRWCVELHRRGGVGQAQRVHLIPEIHSALSVISARRSRVQARGRIALVMKDAKAVETLGATLIQKQNNGLWILPVTNCTQSFEADKQVGGHRLFIFFFLLLRGYRDQEVTLCLRCKSTTLRHRIVTFKPPYLMTIHCMKHQCFESHHIISK